MKNVKFLQTSAGSYGLAHTDDELVLKDGVASQLEKAGVVEILGDAGDAEESVPTKGSVRFTEEKKQGGAPAGETNENNPTGPDVRKEKNAKAGPNPPKKGAKKGGR